MSIHVVRTQTQFGPATPVLPAQDVAESLAFYIEKLGFVEAFRDAEPPTYAGLMRGESSLHLFTCREPKIADSTAFRIGVVGIDALYERCRIEAIVHPNGAMAKRPWGTREFSVLDPAGVCITFWETEST